MRCTTLPSIHPATDAVAVCSRAAPPGLVIACRRVRHAMPAMHPTFAMAQPRRQGSPSRTCLQRASSFFRIQARARALCSRALGCIVSLRQAPALTPPSDACASMARCDQGGSAPWLTLSSALCLSWLCAPSDRLCSVLAFTVPLKLVCLRFTADEEKRFLTGVDADRKEALRRLHVTAVRTACVR